MQRKELERIPEFDLEGNITNIIKKLSEIKKKWEAEGYDEIIVEMETEWGYYDDSWNAIVIYGTKHIKNGRDLFKQ